MRLSVGSQGSYARDYNWVLFGSEVRREYLA
jgi:hypothetical protein